VAEARRRFSDLLRSASREPQRVYRREQLVAVVVDEVAFAEMEVARAHRTGRALGDAMGELRALLSGSPLPTTALAREDREDVFAKVADDHAG
jgi:hypothetical protein